MSRQIQFRRGTADEHKNFTGAIGEITVDTTNNTLRVHDGSTLGGTLVAKQDEIPQISDIINAMMPDYSNAISIPASGTYTAESNLYIQGYVKLVWNATASIKILTPSGTEVTKYLFQADNNNATRYMSFSIIVPRGYSYNIQHGQNSSLVGSIIPFIGG